MEDGAGWGWKIRTVDPHRHSERTWCPARSGDDGLAPSPHSPYRVTSAVRLPKYYAISSPSLLTILQLFTTPVKLGQCFKPKVCSRVLHIMDWRLNLIAQTSRSGPHHAKWEENKDKSTCAYKYLWNCLTEFLASLEHQTT